MTTKEQILNFFVLWTGPERNSLRPFRGMMYRGEFVRGREEASEEEGEESVRRQLHGGAKRRRHGGAKRRRHEVEKRARRHAIRRARRQEAARRGRRAARTREEVKYRKEGRQKRAERTGGRGRQCTEAEYECGWRGHGEGYKKRAAEELNLPPLTYRCCINRPGVWRPGAKSETGGQVPNAGGRVPESRVGDQSRNQDGRFGYASRRCLSISAAKGRRTPAESMRPASRMPPFESK